MFRKFFITALAVIATGMSVQAAPDLASILAELKNKMSGNDSTATTGNNNSSNSNSSSSSSSSSGILDQLSALGSALGLIPEKTVDVAYLTGVWEYQKPAVAFKSDNFLQKAGGLAASTKIESELSTYYQRLGFDKVKMTFYPDSTFTMALKRGTISGTIKPSTEAGTLTFTMKAFGKLPLGSMAVYVNGESNSQMAITFDVSKLIDIMTKVSSLLNNSTLKAATALLNSYDGLTAGFRMTKTSNTPPEK